MQALPAHPAGSFRLGGAASRLFGLLLAEGVHRVPNPAAGLILVHALQLGARHGQMAAAKAGTAAELEVPRVTQEAVALENGPFYAAECGVALTLANLGGLESDSDCHVYNTEREVISGLYVAGAPQGGRFNVQYPISLKGLSAGMCMVFGKIAGENAAAGK